ncbi:ATP-dependent zinc metalloprotease FtsH [Alphaproteobacteria bacterium]|nr:ATP-dependent zinc metalloprotease FtsH [Alphaproteobacteria bacterium]
MKNFSKNIFVWIIISLILLGLFNVFKNSQTDYSSVTYTYSTLLDKAENGEIKSVEIQGNNIYGQTMDGIDFSTYAPRDPNLIQTLNENNVAINAKPEQSGMHPLLSIFVSWFPMLLLIGVWIFFMRQMQSGKGGGALGFGRSKAKLLNENKQRVTFGDVAGIDEAKQELEEVVSFLKDPHKFQRLGAKIPKGALLVGPPGTGKTLLARAIAGEAGVPFFSISGSDFVEMFVGVGASRVRDMFEQGKKNAPCIIFIDEIDAVGRHRGAGLGGGNDEREQTLNQLLVEMDGFEANEGVIIVAATNRPDVLDPALLRPGRFDRQVVVPAPDIIGRDKILKVHTKKIKMDKSVKTIAIARSTPGFSGADLANIVNEAALIAARKNKKIVTMDDFEDAKDKVMLGTQNRSKIISDSEKEVIAYHEAGHALANLHCKNADPIYKSSIIPTGRALGFVMSVPEQDKVIHRKDEYLDKLVVTVAARISEELIFGPEKIGSGAAGDIQQVTNLARAMVTQMGYSEKLGRVRYTGNQEEVFLGHSVTQSKNISEETARIIDQEVIRLVQEAETKARKILTENMKDLHIIAKGLLEYETLTGEEIKNLLKGIKPKRDDDLSDDTDKPSDDVQKSPSNKGPLPSFTKDQNFPLPN